jgi:hypothetical protein
MEILLSGILKETGILGAHKLVAWRLIMVKATSSESELVSIVTLLGSWCWGLFYRFLFF